MIRYSTISLPINLYEKIQRLIEEKPEIGYNSVADFSKEAIRLHVEGIKQELRQDFLRRLDVPLILRQIERLSAMDVGTYGEMFEKGNCMVFVVSREFRFLECNGGFVSGLGYGSKDELLGRDVGVVFDDERLKGRLRGGKLVDYDVQAVRKDGKRLDVMLSVNRLSGGGAYIGIVKDVSVLRYLLDKEKKTREVYENLINDLSDIIVVVQDGKIKYVNKEMGKGGYTKEELIGMKVDTTCILAKGEHERVAQIFRKVLSGKGDCKSVKFKGFDKKGNNINEEVSFKRIDFEGRPAVLAKIRYLP